MISSIYLYNQSQGQEQNCTTVSTFEKPSSLRFSLLFGSYEKKHLKDLSASGIKNAFEYLFLPGKIFGISCESSGQDYKKFNLAFVLRACASGENGTEVPGVMPGAEVLLKTLTKASSVKMVSIIKKIQLNGLDPSTLDASTYRYLDRLILLKMKTDFFEGGLLERAKSY